MLLAERGIAVVHVTIYRWLHTFTTEFVDAGGVVRCATGVRWFVDEADVEVVGRWTDLFRSVDQHGRVIDVLESQRRDGAAARAFTARALKSGPAPVDVRPIRRRWVTTGARRACPWRSS